MRIRIAFAVAIGSWISFASAQSDGSSATSFCDPSLCTEISAGYAYLGNGRRCVVARNKTALAVLYQLVAKAENTGGTPQPPATAIAILNAKRAKQGLQPVTLDNFASAGTAFLAISLTQDERYSLEFSSTPVKNQIDLILQSGVVPGSRRDSVDRRPQTTLNPFYRIVALSKPLLQKLQINGWSTAKVYLDTPDVENILCTAP
ncbi:MAG: hypothetical protein V1798_02730 [Pseudomonadota bacterium]